MELESASLVLPKAVSAIEFACDSGQCAYQPVRPTKTKAQSADDRKGLVLSKGERVMNLRKLSPISVEIIARCGSKIRIELKLVLPVAALVAIISTVKWLA